MARRAQTRKPSEAGKEYPSVKLDRPPAPPPGRAIEFRSAQLALWHRLRRSGRRVASAIGCFVLLIVIAIVLPDNDLVALLAFAIFAVGLIFLLIAIGGTIRTARLYRMMSRYEWAVYQYDSFRMRENLPVRITLIERGTKNRYPVKFRNSKRCETLRGMVHDEIWYAGDPSRHGILTVAGGGEMFRTRPDPPRPVKLRKPVKPRKVKPISPEKARKLAARDAAQRAKWAEQAKKRIAKQRAKPAKPVRQPKLPRIRGAQKIRFK
jgi:hypothetical protein